MILRYDQGMNTPHETLSPNHPAIESLAREVLSAAHVAALLVESGSDEVVMDHFATCAHAAPDLARAVIELTATVKRVEALVDRLEHEAAYEASRGDTWDATCIRAEARRIRRALNGDDQ